MNKPTKPIYSNDRTAPRMRKAKYATQIIDASLWKQLKKQYPEYKGKTIKELNSLWNDIAFSIREEVVENPLGVKLGSYTGELKLQYLPSKFKAENKGISEQIGERVNYTNLLTRGKVVKLKWERRWAVKFNKMLQFFAFSPTRELIHLSKNKVDMDPEKIRVSRINPKNNI